jgi:proteasome component ECM29
MPTAFMAKSDEESDVAAVWAEVWEDSGSSAAAALRLYMADILPLLIQGVM